MNNDNEVKAVGRKRKGGDFISLLVKPNVIFN